MPFQLLSVADANELANAWNQREADLFEKAVVQEFITVMIDKAIERDLKKELMDTISYITQRENLWVSAGLCYQHDHRFTAPNSNRWMSIKQLIYRTDALAQLAKELGPGIRVRPLYDDGVIFFKYEFWPSAI
jgi:hypothetical protein